jgi:8-oxo-dGTP pyrophosphatase MutT (NUDIX family)
MPARWIAASSAVARVADRLSRALAAPTSVYQPFVVEDRVVGWVTTERARRLARLPAFRQREGRIELSPDLPTAQARSAALVEVTRALSAEAALTAWRDERYAVVASPGGELMFEIERAAARYFGIHTYAAHANGMVGDEAQWRMWLARRSPTKAIDPGLLDNLVGGGIATGSDAASTLVKEAWEEAGIASEVARHAQPAGSVEICRDQPDGLQRETIYVHDLWLPAAFVPRNQDGEAVEHRLCEPDEVLEVLGTDDITADASMVIVDFLLRRDHVAQHDPGFRTLDSLRRCSLKP